MVPVLACFFNSSITILHLASAGASAASVFPPGIKREEKKASTADRDDVKPVRILVLEPGMGLGLDPETNEPRLTRNQVTGKRFRANHVMKKHTKVLHDTEPVRNAAGEVVGRRDVKANFVTWHAGRHREREELVEGTAVFIPKELQPNGSSRFVIQDEASFPFSKDFTVKLSKDTHSGLVWEAIAETMVNKKKPARRGGTAEAGRTRKNSSFSIRLGRKLKARREIRSPGQKKNTTTRQKVVVDSFGVTSQAEYESFLKDIGHNNQGGRASDHLAVEEFRKQNTALKQLAKTLFAVLQHAAFVENWPYDLVVSASKGDRAPNAARFVIGSVVSLTWSRNSCHRVYR